MYTVGEILMNVLNLTIGISKSKPQYGRTSKELGTRLIRITVENETL
jgi:hypothetical protein